MKDAVPTRRRLLGLGACLGLAGATPLIAHALAAPTGKVVLTLSGALANPNDGRDDSFDIELLRTLPRTSFATSTPWYAQARKFEGVLLRDLLASVGAPPGAALRAAALNDYRVDIPSDDLTQNSALLAYLLDDQFMTVREKGPLVVIYPFDDRPELRNAVHYSRAIWQLRSLAIQ